MFALEPQEDRWIELVPARGDEPPVEVLFPPQPSSKALRKARDAMRRVLAAGGEDALVDGGDAFSREIVRWSILDWRGIGDSPENPVAPSHDIPVLDENDEPVIGDDGQPVVKLGTISAFVAEPRLMEAADRKFVIPWTKRDAEKNGYAPSPNGTSARATQGKATASRSASRPRKAAARNASTKPRRPRAAKAKPSGI